MLEEKLLGEDVHDFELEEVIDYSTLPATGCSAEGVAEENNGAAC